MNIPSRYFKLSDDRTSLDRWHPGHPVDEHGVELDRWQFIECKRLPLQGPFFIPMKIPGRPLECAWTTTAIPLLHGRVVSLLERLGVQDEVQLIPARVEGYTEPYFLLNALHAIRCIDDARCGEVAYWLPEDNQPEKLGQYRVVSGMKVDPSKIGSANIFRPWGWPVALIISERVKLALEEADVTGTHFKEV